MATADGVKAVVRFFPISAQRLRRNAEDTHEQDIDDEVESPRFGVSVLASSVREGETFDEAVQRIFDRTNLNGDRVAVISTRDLQAHPFVLMADPTLYEPDHHLLGEGDFQAVPNTEELESLFRQNIRKFRKSTSTGNTT